MSQPAVTAREVRDALAAAGQSLPGDIPERLARFLTLLGKWNQVYNLTGIRDPERALDRNLCQCTALIPWLRGSRVADVGTGPGLPGLPVAIAQPERQFLLIDSRARRISFIRHVVGELGLDNVDIAHSRAEDLPKGLAFDTVLARAVAAPPELLQITRHLTVPGSTLAMLTSPEKGAEFRGLAPDFDLRVIEPVGAEPGASAIVVLDRTSQPDRV